MEEIEVKFLKIEPKELEEKLISLGAEKKFDRIFKRRVFDFPDWRLNKDGSWLRVRDEGEKVTMSFKKRIGIGNNGDQGMEEAEVVVSDMNKTAEIFLRLGMIEKFYEENRRIEYILNGVKLEIDWWPLLKPYLEIEGKSWGEVQSTAEKLGLSWEQKQIISTWQLYEREGINEGEYEILTFEKQIKRQML
jgi:adenylate cyclase, class 2